MITSIDSAGRVVIPKEIREAAGIAPGMALDMTVSDGRIEIEPAVVPVTLVKKGRFVVATPGPETPPLTAEAVADTVRTLRQRSGR